MLDQLLPYFERELQFLRDNLTDFSDKYPNVATHLSLKNGQSSDPHTERLIQSFAFLAGRIHRKIDDEYPEVVSNFVDILYPHYQQPLPSSLIIEFELDEKKNAIANNYMVPRHEHIIAQPVNNVSCRFTNIYATEINPLVIKEISVEKVRDSTHLSKKFPEAELLINIDIKSISGITLNNLTFSKLRFYLNGNLSNMSYLYQVLLCNVSKIIFFHKDSEEEIARFTGDILKPVGFQDDENLLYYDKRSFSAYRLLTEYFFFPEKFLFLDLDWKKDNLFQTATDGFRVSFLVKDFSDNEKNVRLMAAINNATFKLHCVPLVNLFKKNVEPIRISHEKYQYPVIPDISKRNAYELFAIEKVVRVSNQGAGEDVNLVRPIYGERSAHYGTQQDVYYWALSREQSAKIGDGGTDCYITLLDLNFKKAKPKIEVLSIEAWCTNREYPEKYLFNNYHASSDTLSIIGHSSLTKLKLVKPPTASFRAIKKAELQVKLMAHLTLNHCSILDKSGESLRQILNLYNMNESVFSSRLISGIKGVQTKHLYKSFPGEYFAGIVRGLDINIVIDEENYVETGIYLFFSIVERFISLYAAPNSFTQVSVSSYKNTEIRIAQWKARIGQAHLA